MREMICLLSILLLLGCVWDNRDQTAPITQPTTITTFAQTYLINNIEFEPESYTEIQECTLETQNQDLCLFDFGVKTDHVSACDAISSQEWYISCMYYLYINQKNLDICLKSIRDDWRIDCENHMYALQNRDISLCKAINDEDSRGYCLTELAIALKDPLICEEITSYRKEMCQNSWNLTSNYEDE